MIRFVGKIDVGFVYHDETFVIGVLQDLSHGRQRDEGTGGVAGRAEECELDRVRRLGRFGESLVDLSESMASV